MNGYLEGFITSFVFNVISLFIGYVLGKNKDNTINTPDVKKQIQQIFNKIAPNPDVGAVTRPTVKQNYYRDNPVMAQEQDVMDNALDTLNE